MSLILLTSVVFLHADQYAHRLQSPSSEQRIAAERDLVKHQDRAFKVLVPLLDHPSPQVSGSAVRVIREISKKNHLPNKRLSQLLPALKKSKHSFARAAYLWVARDQGRLKLPQVLSGLRDRSSDVQYAALTCFKGLPPGFSPAPLLAYLTALPQGHSFTSLALGALLNADKPSDSTFLLPYLRSQYRAIASAAVRLVDKWRIAAFAPELAEVAFAARDKHFRQFCFACCAHLGQAGLDQVITRAKSRDANLRLAAAAALRFFPESSDILFSLLVDDPYPMVQQEASRSLQHLNGLDKDQAFFLAYDGSPDERLKVIHAWRKILDDRR